METTARIHILGAAAVLVSGVKLEDWKLVEKHTPEALKVKDENGEPVFRVTAEKGSGSVNRYGIVWGSYTTEEGYATVTILLDEDIEDKKAAVMDVAGSALMELIRMEGGLSGVLEQIRRMEQEIGSLITQV